MEDYPKYKNIKMTEFWGGEINNKDDEYTINMNIEILQFHLFLQLNMIQI